MLNLDDINKINKLDKNLVYASVEELPEQCLHAWKDTKNLIVPKSYENVNKILMTGMGGSGLGARIIESVFGQKIRYPLIRLNDYDLPDWVDEQTLVICSSFSGTTEETVENAHQAQNRKAKWMAIGTGEALINFARKNKVPYYQIIPTHNPSKQPRMAMGYSIVGQLVMAARAGIIKFSEKELFSIVEALKKVINESKLTVNTAKNPAKQLAKNICQKKTVFVAARHMLGSAHTIKNQMNENAKSFSTLFDIPELNHHLMEGLQFPKTNSQNLFFLFVNSTLYPKRIQQRFSITQEIVKDNKIPSFVWKATTRGLLAQVFEFIQFGGYVNFYLAMLNGIDPAPIPYVDRFKIKLGQPLGMLQDNIRSTYQ